MTAASQRTATTGGSSPKDRFEDYVPVAERLERFYERYPDGRVITHLVEHDSGSGFALMRAEVYRAPDDAQPAASGHAFEVRGESYVNKTSYIENCETSAVGRALALLGFEIKRGIASREELHKTERAGVSAGGGSARLKEVKPQEDASSRKPSVTPQGERAELLKQCGELFREMNSRGYQPQWTGATITVYVNGKFLVKRGTDDLTPKDLRELVTDLTAKRDRLSDLPGQDEMARERARLRGLIEAEFARREWRHEDVTEYLRKHCNGVPVADMSLDQLLKVCEDELIDTNSTATVAVSGGQS